MVTVGNKEIKIQKIFQNFTEIKYLISVGIFDSIVGGEIFFEIRDFTFKKERREDFTLTGIQRDLTYVQNLVHMGNLLF